MIADHTGLILKTFVNYFTDWQYGDQITALIDEWKAYENKLLPGRRDEEWTYIADQYRKAKHVLDNAKQTYDEVKQDMVTMLGEHDSMYGCGVKISKVTSKGRVDSKRMYQDFGITPSIQDKYRGEPTLSHRITLEKDT